MLLRIILIPIIILSAPWLFVYFRTPYALGLVSILTLTGAVVAEQAKSRRVRSDGSLKASRSHVLIIGAGKVGKTLAANLEATGLYQVVGFVDDQQDPTEMEEIENDRILGTLRDTTDLIKEYAIDEVFVAYAPTWQQRLTEQLAVESPHVSIQVVPSHYESMMRVGSVEHRGDIALVRLQTTPGRYVEFFKRLLDVIASALGLLLLSPLMLIVALSIKLTSRGCIIFAQERVGRYGKPFMVFKFRTMEEDAEQATGPILATGKNDARLTAVGRWLRMFRVDEIPQLWNVLRGEMSLVGPRPERTYFVQQFEQTIPTYSKRHQVRPGITGLAQVCGGYHTDARDKLRFDLIYISHLSLWQDLMILFRTVLVVIFPKH